MITEILKNTRKNRKQLKIFISKLNSHLPANKTQTDVDLE